MSVPDRILTSFHIRNLYNLKREGNKYTTLLIVIVECNKMSELKKDQLPFSSVGEVQKFSRVTHICNRLPQSSSDLETVKSSSVST